MNIDSVFAVCDVTSYLNPKKAPEIQGLNGQSWTVLFYVVAGNAGFEPAASSSGGWRSIQLS